MAHMTMGETAADLSFVQEYAPILAPGGALLVGLLTVGTQLWIAKRSRDEQRAALVIERAKARDDERVAAHRTMVEVLLRLPAHPGPPHSLDKSLAWADKLDLWVDDFRLSLWAVLRYATPSTFEAMSKIADTIRSKIRAVQKGNVRARQLIERHRVDGGGSGTMSAEDQAEVLDITAHVERVEGQMMDFRDEFIRMLQPMVSTPVEL